MLKALATDKIFLLTFFRVLSIRLLWFYNFISSNIIKKPKEFLNFEYL